MLFHGFGGSGIQGRLTWVVLAQGFPELVVKMLAGAAVSEGLTGAGGSTCKGLIHMVGKRMLAVRRSSQLLPARASS